MRSLRYIPLLPSRDWKVSGLLSGFSSLWNEENEMGCAFRGMVHDASPFSLLPTILSIRLGLRSNSKWGVGDGRKNAMTNRGNSLRGACPNNWLNMGPFGRNLCKVEFQVKAEVPHGVTVRVSGSVAQLGYFSPGSSIPLHTSPAE